mmetsp:Transcript_20112/g.41031  ORF Transcript_20112/g.41031 Transcript_20112/m.41031 type:complete len:217 (+) Transcript_20112:403-1053(+)
MHGRAEVVLQKAAQNRLDVLRQRRTRAFVDVRLVDDVGGHVRGLQNVDYAAHVSVCQPHARIQTTLDVLDLLGIGDDAHPLEALLAAERRETEASAARLEGGYDLGRVVTDEAEPRVARVLFDDAPQCRLRWGGHVVRLVEDDHLRCRREHNAGARELLDLVAHSFDSTVIRCVQLEDHGLELLAIQLVCASENCGGFASSRRAVEEQVRQLSGVD